MSAPATETGPALDRDATATREGSGAMFDAIAPRYDLLNRVLSVGIDRGWRRRAAASLQLAPGARALDLATGTGDLAIAIARAVEGAHVIGLDPSAGMLAAGADKVRRSDVAGRVQLVRGDAEAPPFPDDSFDGVSIAFGIRNVRDRPRALREMARVARPGARVAILELSEPNGGVLGPLARFHVHTLVPRIGALLSGAREYRYLQRSIAAFPSPAVFAASIEEAGLTVERVEPLTFGVCCLFVARAKRGGTP